MIKLPRGNLLRVRRAAGKTVTTHSGAVWITEQDSPRDVMLHPGQRLTLIQNGLVLVEAISDASISLEP